MRYNATTENAVEASGLVKRFGKTTALAVKSLLWAPGIFLVFAPLAVRLYRRKT
jgi:hypothetical protein